MAKIKINYTEIDGLLYPDLEIENNELLNSLGKYGTLRLRYLYEYKPEMYRELLLTDKLAEHCGSIDNAANHSFNMDAFGQRNNLFLQKPAQGNLCRLFSVFSRNAV